MPLFEFSSFSITFSSICKWVVLYEILNSLSYINAMNLFVSFYLVYLLSTREVKTYATEGALNIKIERLIAMRGLGTFEMVLGSPWYRIPSLICCFCLNIPLTCLRRIRLAALTGFRGT